jgi:hypothetical protein
MTKSSGGEPADDVRELEESIDEALRGEFASREDVIEAFLDSQ